MKITNIWYESDQWQEDFDEPDANADVRFELDDGTAWVASFYTYQNLQTLAEKNRGNGEMLAGQYFCADKPIFIARMNKELIVRVLEEMLRTEPELSAVFTRADD